MQPTLEEQGKCFILYSHLLVAVSFLLLVTFLVGF
jgi:hypothetical protein